MDEETTISEGGLTRREMLKKSALVGAVAWAAPVVSSFSTPAFAQVTVSPSACADFVCGGTAEICGTSPHPAPRDICICDVDSNGDPVCFNNDFCADRPLCSTNADCESGICISTCCGTVCASPCGTVFNPTTESQSALTDIG